MKVRLWGAFLLVLAPAAARAQLVVDPSGAPLTPQAPSTSPAAPAPSGPPNPYAVPGTIGLGNTMPAQPAPAPAPAQPGRPGQPAAEPQAPPAMYLGSSPGAAEQGSRYEGETTPDVHVVQKGDTLWDICAFYFGDAWKWPEIWGYNPQITNPHWIYPGDLVRLAQGASLVAAGPATAPATAPDDGTGAQPPPPGAPSRLPTGVELRQLAFISTEDLKVSGKVVGSKQEKELLSANDDVYVEYPAGKPPQVGRRYAVYTPTRDIKHPETGQVIGAYVMVRGEITVTDVKKDKQALGRVTQVTNQGVIERGERVGTLKTQFQSVEPVAADRSLEGVIAGIIGTDILIGEWQVVFLDRGAADGLKPGNQMLVVRRGDALPRKHGELSQAGMADRKYPDNYIASVLVVEVGKKTAVGLVLRSEKEILIGDHVLMRRPN